MNTSIPTRWLAALPILVLLASCSGSTGGSEGTVLAEADIGPSGGTIEVLSGTQTGLRLTIPGGTLDRSERIRIVRPAFARTSVVLQPGELLRLEPVDLQLTGAVEIIAPFTPEHVQGTGPGNVRGRVGDLYSGLMAIPTSVDVAGRRVGFTLPSLGWFQVVVGPVTDRVDFLPTKQELTEFGGGGSLLIEESLGEPNFPQRPLSLWRLSEGEGLRDLSLYVDPTQWEVVGRFDVNADWQEVWAQGAPLVAYGPQVRSTSTQIYSPYGSAVATGSGLVDSVYQLNPVEPVVLPGRTILDVALADLTIVARLNGMAAETVRLRLWLSPVDGVVAMQWDDGAVQVRAE